MNPMTSTIRKDVKVQVRNKLYAISIGLACVFAIIFSILLKPEQIITVIPAAMLLLVGGTTLVFVGGLILSEKEEGILHAIIVSPLSAKAYLGSKIMTLTFLASIEVMIMVGIPIIYLSIIKGTRLPNLFILIVGIIVINLLYTILGIALTVRFNKITDYMIPVVMLMIILQIPIVHFWQIFEHPLFLIIPTSAPIMFIQGAFISLTFWEWLYAIVYMGLMLIGLTKWALKAYDKHIIMKVG